VRQNIWALGLNTAEYQQLRTALEHYIDEGVLQDHCLPGDIHNVESDWSFLPFHRVYLEGLEDYLYSLGEPWRNWVPLPKWAPNVSLPPQLQFNDPDCASFDCFVFGGAPSQCDAPQNWNPQIQRPDYLQTPILAGPGNDLCDWFMEPVVPDQTAPDCCPNGLSRKIEYPHHDDVHDIVANGWPGGVMRGQRSPAAFGFWFFHAYIDDIWKQWEMECPQSPMAPVDLYMKDTHITYLPTRDRGEEPNIDEGPMWLSTDIWVRRDADDGVFFQEHQNPDHYDLGGTNYVYVRVRNRGSQPSPADLPLNLYWSKAATALSWPSHWDGSITSPALMGEQIGQPHLLPSIKPGGSHIEVFEWNAPDPQVYADAYNLEPGSFFANEPWHFCLLARVEDGLPMPETADLNGNVKQNNNIVWKNVSVVDIAGNLSGGTWADDKLYGASVLTGDAWGTGGTFDLAFRNPDHYRGNPVTEEAEVRVTLSAPLWDLWVAGGMQMDNLAISRIERHQLIVTGSPARLKNITFEPNQRELVHVGFNFLSRKLSGQPRFDFDLVQEKEGLAVGGERYHIIVPGRQGFYANAGADKLISPNTSVDLNADPIGESAIYNWYDPEGNLIQTGTDLTVSPAITTKYKLEVIAELDGVKDYDQVEVKIKDHEITNVAPNPVSGTTTVSYRLTNATSAFLVLWQGAGNGSNQYILNVAGDSIQLNVSDRAPGTYNLVLVVNGQPVDLRTVTIL